MVGEQEQEDMVAKQDEAWAKLKEQETVNKEDYKQRTQKAADIADEKMKDLIWMVPEEHREKFEDIFKSLMDETLKETGIDTGNLGDI